MTKTTSHLSHKVLRLYVQNTWKTLGKTGEPPTLTPNELWDWMPPFNSKAHSKFLHNFFLEFGFLVTSSGELPRPKGEKNPPDAWDEKAWYFFARTLFQHSIDVPVPRPDESTPDNTSHSDKIALRPKAYVGMFKIFARNDTTVAEMYRVNIETINEAIGAVHKLWNDVNDKHPNDFSHPLAPIIKAWIDYSSDLQPAIRPESRHTQIMPGGLHAARAIEKDELPIGLFAEQGIEQQLMIPDMIDEKSQLVPALPLDVYEASQGKPPRRGGKGAPLEQRIWVNAILAYPFAARQSDGSRRMETTLRDIIEWAYPKGWHRTHCLPRIQTALENVHNMRTRWERRRWNIVQVFAMPDDDVKLDDPLPLLLRLPDGMSGAGPMINALILRLLSVESAPQFRAWIKLAYIWDNAKRKNKGHRIYATRPKVLRNGRGQAIDPKGTPVPKNNWNHEKAVWLDEEEQNPAIKHVPVLTDDDLIRLFFDDSDISATTRRRRLGIAKDELASLASQEFVVLHDQPHGIRIIEPKRPYLKTKNCT